MIFFVKKNIMLNKKQDNEPSITFSSFSEEQAKCISIKRYSNY